MFNTVSTRRLKLAVVAFCVLATSTSYADTFGTGGNTFTMEFVTIGNPGNADDTTGNPSAAGAVGYTYNMGKFEVSRDMITKASAEGVLGITLQDMTGIGGNGVNRPATGVSWNEAARFVNWLNTSSGGFAAYNTSGGANDDITPWTSGDTLDYDAANPFRSIRTNYVLPSMDEWYKAAYHDATAGTAGTYFDYPTGSNTMPDGINFSGDTTFDAVFSNSFDQGTPNDITNAGTLSAYGTMGQGGNVWEWEETEFDLVNNSGSSGRGYRGGAWSISAFNLLSSSRFDSISPSIEAHNIGFRVASLNSVPEPNSFAMLGIAMLGLSRRRRRR